MPVDTAEERACLEELTSDLAGWIMVRARGNSVDSLVALAQVSAEIIKLSSAPLETQRKFVEWLGQYMMLPNQFLEPDPPRRRH